MATNATLRWTFDDYVAWEAEQPIRHEFVRGEVYAISGCTLRHGRVCSHLIGELYAALRGHSCEAFLGTTKLHVAAVDCSYYPDAMVNCAPADIEERGVMHDATVVFEVLSPSTAAHDKGEKLEHYQLLPSLSHYVIIGPNSLTIEVFDRHGDDWGFRRLRGDGLLRLDALGIELSLPRLFDGIGPPLPSIGRPVAAIPPAAD